MTPDFSKFEQTLGVFFRDKALLEQAFTHRSYINENPGIPHGHNERLEFLGDAVLQLAVTRYLFEKYPDRPEGELTAYRSALVNTNSISDAARVLGMNDYLLLSKGESRDIESKARGVILANAYEALIGSVYLDQGFPAAEGVVSSTLFGKIDEIVKKGLWRDAKSYVQEKAQEAMGMTPSYRVHKETGPDHDKNFIVGIYFGETLVAEGHGRSKQEAEQDAARVALEAKKWN